MTSNMLPDAVENRLFDSVNDIRLTQRNKIKNGEKINTNGSGRHNYVAVTSHMSEFHHVFAVF
jgi:hypothetical protein